MDSLCRGGCWKLSVEVNGWMRYIGVVGWMH